MDDHWRTARQRVDIPRPTLAEVLRYFPGLTPAAIEAALAKPAWYQRTF
jgi:hypothetical protein